MPTPSSAGAITRSAWARASRSMSALPSSRARVSVSPRPGQRVLVDGARAEALRHVHRHDRAFGPLGHDVHRKVVEDAAVDEQPVVQAHRLDQPGERHARAHRDAELALPVDDEVAAHEVAADAEEVALEVLDEAREIAPQHRLDPRALDQRVARHAIVGERTAAHPFLVAAGVDLVGLHAERVHRGDERAHAAAADAVDLDPRRRELVEHADVRECARAAAGEHDAHRAPGDPARRTRDAARHVARADHVQRTRRRAPRATAWRRRRGSTAPAGPPRAGPSGPRCPPAARRRRRARGSGRPAAARTSPTRHRRARRGSRAS